ncbi:MAG TPA: sigma-70 family RNA polymerase sigma factor [Terriglobales bacterium]|jgi:RNA polymerase sigma-70 factor (ECF subfamily)|nr:sigma-70 family RNA polymerase sigma factor [Terriglobales bacterium]
MISDEALMQEFRGGSQAAFEELFTRYRGPLYGLFRRRLERDQRAEDLTQEVFLAVIRASVRYEPRALVRTYLYGIAMNLLAAERRKQFRDSASGEIAAEPTTQDDSDSVLWMRQALGKLDDAEREMVMLREYEQLSYSEIAELLKLPVNTVRSRLFRARMALKEHLKPERNISASAVEVVETAGLPRAEGEAI